MIVQSEAADECDECAVFDTMLLHVSVAFDQMRRYQHMMYFALIEDGSDPSNRVDDTNMMRLSSRVESLKRSIERDSVVKRPQHELSEHDVADTEARLIA